MDLELIKNIIITFASFVAFSGRDSYFKCLINAFQMHHPLSEPIKGEKVAFCTEAVWYTT